MAKSMKKASAAAPAKKRMMRKKASKGKKKMMRKRKWSNSSRRVWWVWVLIHLSILFEAGVARDPIFNWKNLVQDACRFNFCSSVTKKMKNLICTSFYKFSSLRSCKAIQFRLRDFLFENQFSKTFTYNSNWKFRFLVG